MTKRVYADHSATTPLKKEVLDAMVPYLTENFGNASSIYLEGRESKKAIETAREQVAKAIGAQSNEIYFTGSGTEADNWAIKGVAYALAEKGKHIITSAVEHHAVLHTVKALEKEGFKVTYLPVDEYGMVSAEDVKNAITDETILITIMFANNEIGTIMPIEEIGKIAREKGIIFHTDAVQAVGMEEIDVEKMNIDLLSLTAHKFYGPKGIGALYIRKGVKIKRFIEGGAQEKNKRAGTENVAGIVGLGKAIELATTDIAGKKEKLSKLRDFYIKEVMERIPFTRLNGHPTKRMASNANISFEFIEGESLLLMLDMKGISASSGSACTSGSLDPSHVLLAIGLPHEIAHGSLRVTFGDSSTMEDAKYIADSLVEIVTRLRDMSPLYEDAVKSGRV
ncbi:MAG: cysteine desulfurase NifS [Clostridia bacterium]|nr:cysteine desulfurase NifS [Clostridia bacterium]